LPKLSIFTHATLFIGDLKFGEMQFGEMKMERTFDAIE